MLEDYLKSGNPAIYLLTPEPERGEKSILCNRWTFYAWDCLRGIRKAGTQKMVNDTQPIQLRLLILL